MSEVEVSDPERRVMANDKLRAQIEDAQAHPERLVPRRDRRTLRPDPSTPKGAAPPAP